MDGDVLRDIVAVEKEIQLFLAAETGKAEALVARTRKEQQARLEEARGGLEEEAFAEGERVVAEAEAEAERILLGKERELKRFRGVDEAMLRAVVASRIRAILPVDAR